MQTDDQARALAGVAATFPRWESLTAKVRTVGELLQRQTGPWLRKDRGWETFADGLRDHIDLPPRPFAALVKWLNAQPLGALAGVSNGN
jgi:hypothetical protein